MSIAARVGDTIDKMKASDPEGALFSICAAIEATAKKEGGKGGRKAYKDFIHNNLGLITRFVSNIVMHNINLPYDHPKIKKTQDGLCSVQDILYHVVRCGLYHDAKLPDDLKFTNEGRIQAGPDVLVLPASLIYGFVAAVVVSPTNVDEVLSKPSVMNIGNVRIPINKLWGRRAELMWLLDAIV